MSQYPRRTGNDFRGGVSQSLDTPGLSTTPPDGGSLAITDQIAGVFRDFRGAMSAGASLANDIAQSELATAAQQERERRQALNDQKQADEDQMRALDKARDISMGQGRQIAADTLPQFEALVATGEAPPPANAKQIASWAKEQANALADAQGLTDDQRSGFIAAATPRIASVAEAKVVQVVGDARSQLIKDASREAYAVAEDNPSDLPGMVKRVATATGLPENEVKGGLLRQAMFDHAKAGRIKAVNAIAGVLGDEYRSDIDLANTVYDRFQADETQRLSNEARRTVYSMLENNEPAAKIKEYAKAKFATGEFDEGDAAWANNVTDMRERYRIEEVYRQSAEQQLKGVVDNAVNAISNGTGSFLQDQVITTGPDKTKTITSKEQRDAAFQEAFARIDAQTSNPVEREAMKFAIAKGDNYVPPGWTAQTQSVVSQFAEIGPGLTSAMTGKPPVITPEMETVYTRYARAKATNPVFAAELAGNEKTAAALDAIAEFRTINGNGSLADAVSAWSNALRTGATPKDPANIEQSMMDILGSEDGKDFQAQDGIVAANLRRLVGVKTAQGMSITRATQEATDLLKARTVEVNGYSTFVVNREYMPDQKMFVRLAEKWTEGVVKDLGNVNIHNGEPLTANDVRFNQDPMSGMWSLIDTRTQKMVNFGDRQNVHRVSFTTQELMSTIRTLEPVKTLEQRSEEARMTADKAAKARTAYSARYDLGVPPRP